MSNLDTASSDAMEVEAPVDKMPTSCNNFPEICFKHEIGDTTVHKDKLMNKNQNN